jgi:GAF domain-containing protein
MSSPTESNIGIKLLVSEEQSLSTELSQYMNELNRSLDFESGTLFLIESDNQSLREVAQFGDGIDFISKVSFPMGRGLSAWVAQKGKVIYLPDIHRGSRHGLNPIRSYISMPLEINNKIIGVLNLGHLIPNAFDSYKLEAVENMIREMTRKIYNVSYLNYFSNKRDQASN